MNVFVCSVQSYSEVSSKDYLIASNKHIHLLFGSWFRNPPKKQKLGEKVSEKVYFKLGMDI